jgi:hypothetical protein
MILKNMFFDPDVIHEEPILGGIVCDISLNLYSKDGNIKR